MDSQLGNLLYSERTQLSAAYLAAVLFGHPLHFVITPPNEYLPLSR
jgi:hypothetical protein